VVHAQRWLAVFVASAIARIGRAASQCSAVERGVGCARGEGSRRIGRGGGVGPGGVVPSSANRAWFWLTASSWPWHASQPFGITPKPIRRISPRKGSIRE
nr:hypothetical protein [Tanacetum cinerariifolium]